jgi:hypothetical protein
MPLGVPWCRNDSDSWPDLCLTGEFLIGCGGEIDQLIEGVVAIAGSGQLDVLDQNGLAAQERIPAAVVEVKVAVRHERDVAKSNSGRRHGVLQVSALGPVVGFGLGVRVADAGVEEDQAVIVLHQIGKHSQQRHPQVRQQSGTPTGRRRSGTRPSLARICLASRAQFVPPLIRDHSPPPQTHFAAAGQDRVSARHRLGSCVGSVGHKGPSSAIQ